MFSILILTYNEEKNLSECLDSVFWCDDIWVLDSGSTDRTVEIAKEHGCHLLTRKFDNFGDQRNYAIDTATFKYPWVFDLDADERFTDALKAECEEMVRKDEKSAYYCSYKNIMWGKWLKYSTGFPVYQMRFHKLGEIRFENHGHGQREGNAKRGIGYLKEPYLHYNFSKGLADWFAKHVEYARREAALRIQKDNSVSEPIVGSDKMARHRRLQRIAAKMPFKPILKFFYIYVFNMGFLDGLAGLRFARMQMWYQFATETIYKDMKRNAKSSL
ncbi:MAG: glycosyltransferase family 2 protein [Synergistaceae bacterium]|nr:glycosyltransferase family 2 protein [Synergistaceae bacterium]